MFNDMMIADFFSHRDVDILLEYVLIETYRGGADVIDYQRAYRLGTSSSNCSFVEVQQDYIRGYDVGISLKASSTIISNLEKELDISADVKR